MIFFRSITAFVIALWVITASAGIYVDKVDHPKKVVILKIEGRIKYEDDLEFRKVLDEIKSDGYKMTKPYSEATAEMIDQEVSKLVQHAYTRVLDLLRKHQVELEILAKELLEKEILFQADLERLIGKRPFEEKKILDVVNEEPIVPNATSEEKTEPSTDNNTPS